VTGPDLEPPPLCTGWRCPPLLVDGPDFEPPLVEGPALEPLDWEPPLLFLLIVSSETAEPKTSAKLPTTINARANLISIITLDPLL
jgi:hypothetical protein